MSIFKMVITDYDGFNRAHALLKDASEDSNGVIKLKGLDEISISFGLATTKWRLGYDYNGNVILQKHLTKTELIKIAIIVFIDIIMSFFLFYERLDLLSVLLVFVVFSIEFLDWCFLNAILPLRVLKIYIGD